MNNIISQILLYITDFSKTFQKMAGGGTSGINYYWLILLFALFAVFLVGLNWGRSRAFLSLISLYIAAFLYSNFIYFDQLQGLVKIGAGQKFWLNAGLFLVLFILVFLAFNRSFLKHRLTMQDHSFWQIALIAILQIGLFASIIISFLPPEITKFVPAIIVKYISTKTARFWWAALPIIASIFMRKKGYSET